MPGSKVFSLCAVLLLAVLSLPPGAAAHKVNVFAYAEAQTVYTESYFPDGSPVASAHVLVYDSAKNLLLDGTTDAKGLFSFPVPKIDDLTIVIEASMGHRNEFLLKKAELKE